MMSLPGSSMLWRRMPSPSVTPNELLEILTQHTNGYYVLPTEPYDEVFPDIVLGDSTTALCLHLLRREGITHVLNAAWGKHRNLGMVNTSPNYYRNSGIEFYGIEALDVAVFPLFEHFYPAVEFIARAVDEGGKVLVHCGEGISRSSTLVIAYLMIKRGFRVTEAVRQVVKHRNILPNQGFLLQLCQLHDQLQSGGGNSGGSLASSTNSSRNENHLQVNGFNRARSMSPAPMGATSHSLSVASGLGALINTTSNHRTSISPLPERRYMPKPPSSAFAASSVPSSPARLPPFVPSSSSSSSSAFPRSTTSSPSCSSYSFENSKYGGGSHLGRYSPVDRSMRASSILRDRCPSPLPVRSKWSNNWTPPTPTTSSHSSSLSSSLYHRPMSPSLSRYRRAASPCRSELTSSPIFTSPSPSRSRRCESVDRMHTIGSSYYSNSFLPTDRMYSNSLMSSYVSRPLTIR